MLRFARRRPVLPRRQSSNRASSREALSGDEDETEKISDNFNTNGALSKNKGDADKFRAFQESINQLDLKLQSFANAIRQLGCSVGLLDATARIQEQIPKILHLFQDNGSKLFGTGVSPNIYNGQAHSAVRRPRRSDSWKQTHRSSSSLNLDSLKIHCLPGQLESLANNLMTFIDRLNDVPEFVDPAVHTTHEPVVEAFRAFAGDLRYRADCLSEFEDKIDNIAITQHINELTEELASDANRVKNALNGFIEVGIPTIRYSQERTAANLQNLSTVATFFSGVTATTIQFSFEYHGNFLQDLLNALWISSLAFSIASAMNSQLAYHWREAIYRSPKCYVPWWVRIWIVYTPLLFLVVSAIAFLVGLCVFAYSSAQSPAVTIFVTAFVCFTSFALLCVGLWFALERLAYSQTQGRRWLLQILDDGVKDAWRLKFSVLDRAPHVARSAYNNARSFGSGVMAYFRTISRHRSPNIRKDDDQVTKIDEEAQFGETQYDTSPSELQKAMATKDSGLGDYNRNDSSRRRKAWNVERENEGRVRFPEQGPSQLEMGASTNVTQSNTPVGPSPTRVTASGSNVTGGQRRFAKQARAVRAALFQRSVTKTRDFIEDSGAFVPRLRTLLSAQLPSQHIGQIGHLQFSPDGQHLATCSWDRTTYIWKLSDGPPMESEIIARLVHPGIPDVAHVGRMAWNPTGNLLLTKYRGSIVLWSPLKNTHCQKHLVRRQHVQTLVWMPDGSGFLSVEWRISAPDPQSEGSSHHIETPQVWGSALVKFDTSGRQTENHTHILDRLQVWDLAVMPDERRLIAVASLIQSLNMHKPINASHQKRILIYNLETKHVESQMPLMIDVQSVMLGTMGNVHRALVSYENNAPQTWHVEQVGQEYRLRLVKAYYPKPPVAYAGISYFGTQSSDAWVLAASGAGEIYIWDRATGNLIHTHVASSTQELQFTGLTRSPKSDADSYVFASAMHDGTVNIWTTTCIPELTTNTLGSQPIVPNGLSDAKQHEIDNSEPLPIRLSYGSQYQLEPGDRLQE